MSDDQKCPKCGAPRNHWEWGGVPLYACGRRTDGVGCAPGGTLRCELNQCQAENERLRAIVDRLPKTADDIPILPGDILWYPQYDTVHEVHVVSIDDYDSRWPATIRVDFHGDNKPSEYHWHVQACYSTREAAEAVKEAQP